MVSEPQNLSRCFLFNTDKLTCTEVSAGSETLADVIWAPDLNYFISFKKNKTDLQICAIYQTELNLYAIYYVSRLYFFSLLSEVA